MKLPALYAVRRKTEGDIRFAAAPPKVRAIVLAVSAETGFSPSEIMGQRRTAALSRARWSAMAKTRGLTFAYGHPSLPQIGRWFGRDHTSVLHGLQKMGLMERRVSALHNLVRQVANETDRLAA